MAEPTRSDVTDRRDSVTSKDLNIGHAAGILCFCIVLFAALYFFVLYVGSE
jgi:hypothetical protein